MPSAAEAIAAFAVDLSYDKLPLEVVHKAKQLLLDTLGCAFGGYLSEPSQMTRATVRSLGGVPEATIIGTGERTSSANAALANCVMVRYLDFMDIYRSKDGCHPSENIPTALAVAERQKRNGRDLLVGIVLGFEVQQRFADAIPCHHLDWHHVTAAGYVTPVVAGKLMNLDREQIANAIGIGGCHNHALADLLGEWWAGTGQISMMKAIGYGFGSQSGITAAMLAGQGFTGPKTIIESFNRVVAQNQDLTPIIAGDDHFKILDTSLKSFPAEYLSQSPVEGLLSLVREHDIDPAAVQSIDVRANTRASILVKESSYYPKTRESADHSIPYCLAMALIDRELTPAQFTREQWNDPKVIDLMRKVHFAVDPEFDLLFPKARPSVVKITMQSGAVYERRIDHPRGSPGNPMTDAEIQDKFARLASPLMSDSRISQIVDTVASLDRLDDVSALMALTIV